MNNLRLIGTLAAAFVLSLVLMWAWRTLTVAPSGAATEFSGEAAFATLSKLYAEGKPHPTGSALNAVVRDRILAEFRDAGYEPEVQATVQCVTQGRSPGCTALENIIAVKKGTSGRAVLATGHYDSVPAGPGVADDGAGTAVMIELARELKARETKNDIIFLITDGEETGLRGAVAFATQHPLFKTVDIVVNVEARGTSGPSIMFETGTGNRKLIELMAGALKTPVSNSLAYEIYRLLPNDTDFSIYKRFGLTGYNFALIGSASLYHSSRDDLANMDRNALQHHGDNARALIDKLADTDLASLKSTDDASYYDLFGQTLVHWPAFLNLPLAILAVVILIGLIVVHRAAFSLGAVIWAIVAVVVMTVGLHLLGWLLSFPLGVWPGVHPLDHPAPEAGRIAQIAAAMFAALLVAAFVSPRSDARVTLLVNWTFLALLGAGLAFALPGAAYALLWPSLAFAIIAAIETFARPARTLGIASAVGFALIALFWIAHMLALEAVLGFEHTGFKLMTLLPFALALMPAIIAARGDALPLTAIAATAVVMLAAAFAASQMPPYAPNHPRGIVFTYEDDRATPASPRWNVQFQGAPDRALLTTQGFPADETEYQQFGIFKDTARFKPAANLNLPAPVFTPGETTTAGAETKLRATIRAGNATSPVLGIAIPAGSSIKALRVENQDVLNAERLTGKDPVSTRYFGMSNRDIPVEITFASGTKPWLVVYERAPFPDGAEAQALLAARSADAAPVHYGDMALLAVKVELAP